MRDVNRDIELKLADEKMETFVFSYIKDCGFEQSFILSGHTSYVADGVWKKELVVGLEDVRVQIFLDFCKDLANHRTLRNGMSYNDRMDFCCDSFFGYRCKFTVKTILSNKHAYLFTFTNGDSVHCFCLYPMGNGHKDLLISNNSTDLDNLVALIRLNNGIEPIKVDPIE